MNINQDKRIQYIDNVKGTGIVLIIFAHCIQYFSVMRDVNAYVCAFHVPIFFVISGVLRAEKKTFLNKVYIVKRVKSLLIPYIVFSFINSILKLSVLVIKSNLNYEIFQSEMIELLITGNGTVWFLMTLFCVEIVCSIIINKNILIEIVLMSVLLIIPYFIHMENKPVGVFVIRIIAASGYYLFGSILKNIFDSNKQKLLWGILILIVGNIIYFIFGSDCIFFKGIFTNIRGTIISSISISTGIILLLWYMDEVNIKIKYLDWLGRNSLAMMVLHPIILLCFTYPLSNLFDRIEGIKSAGVSLLLFCSVCFLTVFSTIICNRYFPWCLGKKRESLLINS